MPAQPPIVPIPPKFGKLVLDRPLDLIGMPSQYAKLGIHFQFPDNWTLDESDALAGEESVSVYSPGGAFWSIIKHPVSSAPQELVDAAVRVMRQEYDELDAEPVEESLAGHDLIGCDLNFYCLDLTNTAWIRSFQTPSATYLILCQADDREFTEVEGVFRAITLSLVTTTKYTEDTKRETRKRGLQDERD